MNINLLEQNWLDLLTRLNAHLSLGETVLKYLIAVHSTSNRHYHNLHHVRDLLTQAKSVRHMAECLPAIELAAWLHDCIYDSQAKDNEIRSAIYAESTLTKLDVPADLVHLVKQIVLRNKN